MLFIEDYPQGYNLTLLNVIYKYKNKNEKTGKWEPDYAMILYKDNISGEKKYEIIIEPEYTWYLIKPELQVNNNEHSRDLKDLIPITCKYNELTKSIAEHTGNKDLYYDNLKSGNPQLNKMFFTHPRVFGADKPIRNYLMIEFAKTYQNPLINTDIIFLDIESDIINCISDNITIGEGIVNLVSMYCTKTKTMYCFILRNKLNEQIEKLEYNLKYNWLEYKNKYIEFIKEQVGEEKIQKYGLDNAELSVGFFDTEVDLIITVFNVIKKLDCEFLTGWNLIWYDLRQLIERLRKNGVDPLDYVPDQNIYPRLCNVKIDERHLNEPQERTDLIEISFKTIVLDQEIIFASRRKGQSAIESYSLDFVGEMTTGMRKLDYHDITTNIAKFPYINFELFWLYNIEDVLMLVGIEAETSDIKFTFNNSLEMRTPYDKIYRQTVFLAAKAAEFYELYEHCIMGENVNKFGKKPKEKFPGAYVASPLLLSDKNKVKLGPRSINKFNNTNDFDYKALYPSLLKEFNMSPSTLIGMIQFDNSPYKDPEFLTLGSGGTFLENLSSYNFIEFCHRWLNMANIEEMLEDLEEYYTKYKTPLYKIEQGINPNLPNDMKKIIAYNTDRTKRFYIKKQIPEHILKQVNEIRSNIPLI